MQELEALIETIQKQLKDHPCKDSIRETFQTYDKEASGYVDREMFFKICESLNVPIDDSLVKEVSMSPALGQRLSTDHSFLNEVTRGLQSDLHCTSYGTPPPRYYDGILF